MTSFRWLCAGDVVQRSQSSFHMVPDLQQWQTNIFCTTQPHQVKQTRLSIPSAWMQDNQRHPACTQPLNPGKKTCSRLGVFSFNIKPHSSWVHVAYSFAFQANNMMLIINLSFSFFFFFNFNWDHSVLSHAHLSDQQSWLACLGHWLPRNSVNTVRKWCSPTPTRQRKRSPHSNIGLAQWWATQPWHRPGLPASV